MGKLHELLAVELTLSQAAEKLLAETSEKFNKHSEFFSGGVRTLERLKDSPEDKAIAEAQRKHKVLPTNVPATLAYVMPFVEKALDVKLQKHLTDQVACADIEIDGAVVMRAVPVDFLLDLESTLPKWRALYATMPTLDPSRDWAKESDGVWRSVEPTVTSQTEKQLYPVILHVATPQHPAQVKEAARDVVVGTFKETYFSGAATSQQKADVLALCDRLIVAVKTARMRANSVDIKMPVDGARSITSLFSKVFAPI